MSAYKPRPGDLGFVHTTSRLSPWIKFGEWFLDGKDRCEHVFVVTSASGNLVQAEPGGAGTASVNVWPQAVYGSMPDLTDVQRAGISAAAEALLGKPYGWLDYGSLFLLRLHLRLPFVKARVNDGSHYICSQLVDAAYNRAGVHLFVDGRAEGDVTPGDLLDLFERAGWVNR